MAQKPALKNERLRLDVPTSTPHDFAQVVSDLLEAWQFPGNRLRFSKIAPQAASASSKDLKGEPMILIAPTFR